jgi:hypothetical protein
MIWQKFEQYCYHQLHLLQTFLENHFDFDLRQKLFYIQILTFFIILKFYLPKIHLLFFHLRFPKLKK